MNNIKIYLKNMEMSGMDWIDLDQNGDKWIALVSALINLRISSNFDKFSSSYTSGDLSKSSQLRGVS
jgi:hypothetical protein